MKALHFDGQKMTFLTDHNNPKPGETLVKINLAGICGTDIEILNGYMSYQGIPGHEFVGVVKESENAHLIGKRVVGEINVGCGICESCKKGLERHCPHRTVLGILRRDGAFAQYLSLPEKNLHVIPDQIRDEQAYYLAAVIGGTGSFAIPAADYKDFATAIRAKLIREISGEFLIGRRSAISE